MCGSPVTHYDIEQGGEEWRELRRGCITATGVYTILNGSYRAKRLYATRLRNERNGVEPQQFESEATLFGKENEATAIALYEMTRDVEVLPGGLFVHPRFPWLRASPDGRIGEPGLLEVKCRLDVADHIQCIMDGVPLDHLIQVRSQLIISGRDWCDYFSYCPDAPSNQVTWSTRIARPAPPDEENMLARIVAFHNEWIIADEIPEEPNIFNTEAPTFF